MNHRQAYDKNNGPIYVNTPQGGKRVGQLKNNVLHMDRDYDKHHYRKIPGWAFDKEMFDKNKDRIHAFVLHCRNYPLDSKKGDVILTLDLKMEGLDHTNMQTLDWGHNSQYLVPDRHWRVTVSSEMPSERKATQEPKQELRPSPPSDVFLSDLVHRPLTPQPSPEPDFVFDGSAIKEGAIHAIHLTDEVLSKVMTSSPKLVPFSAAKALVDAGHEILLPLHGPGLYLAKEGNMYLIKSKQNPNIPGLVFVYQDWMDTEPIFSLTP